MLGRCIRPQTSWSRARLLVGELLELVHRPVAVGRLVQGQPVQSARHGLLRRRRRRASSPGRRVESLLLAKATTLAVVGCTSSAALGLLGRRAVAAAPAASKPAASSSAVGDLDLGQSMALSTPWVNAATWNETAVPAAQASAARTVAAASRGGIARRRRVRRQRRRQRPAGDGQAVPASRLASRTRPRASRLDSVPSGNGVAGRPRADCRLADRKGESPCGIGPAGG